MLFRTAATLVAAVLFLMPVLAVLQTDAKCAVLIDADTGAVLFAHNAETPSLIASTTKIMTAVVALESAELSQCYTVPPEACGVEGSSVYLKPGERLTVEELLYCMMLHSGNDAAVALALCCGGTLDAFVQKMNDKAQALSLNGTHFSNPNGLDDKNNHSTALDMARLTAYALKNEIFARIVSSRTALVGTRRLTNHNRLLWSVEGAMGVKTGFTKAAGRILVSAVERVGRRLIAVTFNDGNDWRDHKNLYDYGFALYETHTLARRGEPVGTVELLSGGRAVLCAGCEVQAAQTEKETLRLRILMPKAEFSAGLPGQAAGIGGAFAGERCIATFPLVWGDWEELDGTDTENHIRARHCLTPGG